MGRPERQQLRQRRRPREGTGAAQPAHAPPRTLESVVLRLQSELGNAAAARLLARQPVKAEPAEPPITRTGVTGAQDWFDRAHAHYQAGRYEKAMHAYREAYRLYPVNSFLYNVGACLEQLGRKGEAADMYERYLNEMPKGQSDPKEPKIREHIKQLRGQAPTTAPTQQQPAAPAAPAQQPITATGLKGAQEWFDRAYAHFQAKEYEQALNGFLEAYRLYPVNGFLYNAGTCLIMLGRKAEGADMYERYLDEMPQGQSDPKEAKIKAYINKLRSEADVAPITETGKDGAKRWFDRGQLAFLAGDYWKALESFKQAYGLFAMPEFVYNQGTSLEKLGRPAAAANAFEHYLVIAPNAKDSKETIELIKKLRAEAAKETIVDPWADESAAPAVTATGLPGAQGWYDRGRVAYALGDFKRAYDFFVRAYDAQPFPDFVYNQAASLQRHGNIEGAIQAYERYLLLKPKADDAEQVRRMIKRLREGELKKP
jgi:tetratricopeptide (TPR) repeat protein